MWYPYLWVFLATILVDILPFPLPPAFTVMIFLQIKFDLNIWWVILIGVAGSILGRYILTLYIPKISQRIFNPSKNEDVQFLGSKLRDKGWKSQVFIFIYSLLPLPTTPLFIASGMSNIRAIYIIPAFSAGKLISDTIAVFMGEYATQNTQELWTGIVSWKSITGLCVGLMLIFILVYVDWRSLIQERKFTLKFNIWK